MGIRERLARISPRRVRAGSDVDRLRRSVHVTQVGPNIEIVVEFSSDVVAEHLCVRDALGQWIQVAAFREIDSGRSYRTYVARFSYEDTEFNGQVTSPNSTDAEDTSSARAAEPLGLFIEIVAPASTFMTTAILNETFLESETPDDTAPLRGRLKLGRFKYTDLSGLATYTSDQHQYLLYSTSRGYLALAVDAPPRPNIRIDIRKARIEKDNFSFDGVLYTHHTEPISLEFALQGRDTNEVISVPFEAREDTKHPAAHWGHRSYLVSASVPLSHFLDVGATDEIFTAWVFSTSTDASETHRTRVGKSRHRVRRRANEDWVEKGNRAALVSTYYTYLERNLSLTVEHFDAPQLRQMLAKVKKPGLREPSDSRSRPVWLIGEQKFKAQDTGLAFFKFMRAPPRD